MDEDIRVKVELDRYKVSRKLKFVAWLTTAMGFLLFAYPVVFILSLVSSLKAYNINLVLDYLNKIYFLTIPNIVASTIPTETNAYIAYAVTYVLFAILFMIVSNFLLERNLLAIAFAFVAFLSLSVSEYMMNHSLDITLLWKNPLSMANIEMAGYLIFAVVPLIVIITEIFTEKDFKKEQFYVKIITSVIIIAALILCFKGAILFIQNKDWLIKTFS